MLTEVDSFSHTLNEALSVKQNGYSITDESSETLYRSYQALAIPMFSILGRLISLFAADPLKCEHYFPMNILRYRVSKNGKQEENGIYTLSVPAGGSAPADLNFSSGDKLMLSNTGEISVWYYGATSATAAAPDNPAELQPDTEIEVSGTQLGAPLNKYLIFLNKDMKKTAEIEITLL